MRGRVLRSHHALKLKAREREARGQRGIVQRHGRMNILVDMHEKPIRASLYVANRAEGRVLVRAERLVTALE